MLLFLLHTNKDGCNLHLLQDCFVETHLNLIVVWNPVLSVCILQCSLQQCRQVFRHNHWWVSLILVLCFAQHHTPKGTDPAWPYKTLHIRQLSKLMGIFMFSEGFWHKSWVCLTIILWGQWQRHRMHTQLAVGKFSTKQQSKDIKSHEHQKNFLMCFLFHFFIYCMLRLVNFSMTQQVPSFPPLIQTNRGNTETGWRQTDACFLPW